MYMGNLRPVGAAPITFVCSFLAVVIESLLSNMSLHSLRNAGAKVQKNWQSETKRDEKNELFLKWGKESDFLTPRLSEASNITLPPVRPRHTGEIIRKERRQTIFLSEECENLRIK